MIKTDIDVGYDKIDTIFHLGDVHIRNLKRHSEYREAFDTVYDKIKNYKNEQSLIYVGGDIVHAKTQMSPELIDLTSDFLISLSNIFPTIVIPGNHDCTLNNRNRLDALSPIIKNLNHPKLHYLKDSGIYTIADIDFVVMSIFDKPKKYIKAKDFKSDRTKIALFHGTVSKSKTDFGFQLKSDIKINRFSGYDMALLGDIHKHQALNKKKTIAYCGSLLAQNYGEDLNKGFMKWDVKSRSGEFIKIYNPYGYYTLDVDDGVVPDVDDMPEKARLRLRVSNTDAAQLKLVLSKIRKKYGITEVNVNRVDSLSKTKIGDRNNKINIGDVSSPDYQFSLIEDYLKRNYIIDDDVLSEIRTINKEINFNLPEEEISRNVFWTLKQFEFDNMFSYGTGNKIDFSKIEGINGLFAGNSHGKCVDKNTEIEVEFDEEYIIKKLGFLPDELK